MTNTYYLAMLLGMLAGSLAMYWRPEEEPYFDRIYKALIPLLLAIVSSHL